MSTAVPFLNAAFLSKDFGFFHRGDDLHSGPTTN